MGFIEILANVLSFVGNALFTSSSLFKNKKIIIILQTCNHILSSTATLLIGAFSGMIQDCVLLVKNIVLIFVKDDKKLLRLIINIICIFLGVILGVLVNIIFSNGVWYGYLPVLGILIYSIASTYVFCKEGLSRTSTELIIKIGLIFNGLLWVIYGYIVALYPVMIFNCFTIILSIIAIIKICVNKKYNDKEND